MRDISLSNLKRDNHRFNVIQKIIDGYKETAKDLLNVYKLNNVEISDVSLNQVQLNLFNRKVTIDFINNINNATVNFYIEKSNKERNKVFHDLIISLSSDNRGNLKHEETQRIELFEGFFADVIDEIVEKEIRST